MTAIVKVCTARKLRRCSDNQYPNYCSGWINPGERYEAHAYPPGGEMGYIGWARYATCGTCAARCGRDLSVPAAVAS